MDKPSLFDHEPGPTLEELEEEFIKKLGKHVYVTQTLIDLVEKFALDVNNAGYWAGLHTGLEAAE